MTQKSMKIPWLGGGFKCFNVHPWVNDPIWRAYFSDGLVQPPSMEDIEDHQNWLRSPQMGWSHQNRFDWWKWPSFRNSEACCDLMTSRRHHQWSAPIHSPTWRPWRCWAWRVAYVKGLEMLRDATLVFNEAGCLVARHGTAAKKIWTSRTLWFNMVLYCFLGAYGGIVKWCSGDFFDLESPWIWKIVSQAWISNKQLKFKWGNSSPSRVMCHWTVFVRSRYVQRVLAGSLLI